MTQLEYYRLLREIDEVRLILHAHWIAYNYLGILTIDYDEWDDIALKLELLHDEHPDLALQGYEADFFGAWSEEEGMGDMPVTPYILEVATQMVRREGHSLDHLCDLEIA